MTKKVFEKLKSMIYEIYISNYGKDIKIEFKKIQLY